MTDRKLLELAAKAAGIPVKWEPTHNCFWIKFGYGLKVEIWSPLTDDGDALRLAVKLEINFKNKNGATWWDRVIGPGQVEWNYEPHNSDSYAATRRAIVMAAAEIGKAMP